MYLTAQFGLRTNDHDRRRLRIALARWSAAMTEAMDRARARQRDLLRCIGTRTTRSGREVLAVDGKALHTLVLACCRGVETHLHSSSKMSLIVALEEALGSWLGLYLAWMQGGRKGEKPGFPSLPPGSNRLAEARHEAALDAAAGVVTLDAENRWRAEVLRAGRARLLPMTFGAATSGAAGVSRSGNAQCPLHHCGLLERSDGRWFALLTLWGEGDPLGEPLAVAANHREQEHRWRNPRGSAPFKPGPRLRSSMAVPLLMGRGHERLFLQRAVPKSAELVTRDGEYYLHVAFEFPDREPRPLTGNVLALRRGIDTLVAAAVVDPAGGVLQKGSIDGRGLAALVTQMLANRATRQAKGHVLAGDRRLGRVVEHHLYSAGHQIIDLACRHGAEIVLWKEERRLKPPPLLAYRHFHRLGEILGQLAAEAGLPPPRERPIYGPWNVCVACGWTKDDAVRYPEAEAGECPGCRRVRDERYDHAVLLALDTLRLRERDGEKRPKLAAFVRGLAR